MFAHLPAYYKKQPAKEEQTSTFKTVQSRMNETAVLPEIRKQFLRFEPLQETEKQTEIETGERLFAAKHKLSDEKGWDDNTINEQSLFQMHSQYIVTQIKSGFVVIDQQAAHERILFEKYLERLTDKKHYSQQQLFPRTLNLSASDSSILTDILDEINNLGFDIQPFGNYSFVIHGVPPELNDINDQQVIENLIEQFKENKQVLKINKHVRIAMSMARSNSIKAGKNLSRSEMKNLMDELFACKTPYASPNGNSTFITFSLSDLAKQFSEK
jgi:DNA mismatch repair protein MutL